TISSDSAVFCMLKTIAEAPVIMGLIIPIIKLGIFFIQSNKGRAFVAIVHHVPAVQMVRATASPTRKTAVDAINTLRTVKPWLKSSRILLYHLTTVLLLIMSVMAL